MREIGEPVNESAARSEKHDVTVLVVDDEPNLLELVASAVRYEGLNVMTSLNGRGAVEAARTTRPDVVILDVMLPDLSGFEVLRKLHEIDESIPVIFLTARDAVEDRIAGITVGADDYLTKPFNIEELMARVRGLLRRSRHWVEEEHDPTVVVGDLMLNEDSYEVTRGGDEIKLTATEFELLRFLMRNAKKVMSKTQILDHVWHYDFGGEVNVVELYISYLRKKIDHGREPMIHTVRGVGYVLKPAV
ncbi:response regulator transcription factor [Pseudoclavibacter sp. CFCC 13796]|nr:response regulator transcription factor [Pseudoclavibacter sp. CFCC 11306]KAB1661386.1 response regulator transcription factor [Pseudoclavibacter sp. CFCC 13796]